MEKLKLFVQESYEEMKHKVTWPRYGELQRSSVLVLVASLIFAIVIGLIDLAFDGALGWFYDAF
ncbi:preprotein translocase subunit SecE [Cesiribacter andamanensis]|uniref:Protein translocase subunit SecE n=1 Tax=Cesiribacter andamanensis AMV16 TaxID=1279009 RepID=M7NA33_9BACT|nr:preprotein translocase subunit SecE [Cesiribacter andamanensis]EMR04066.1 preprotein translocase subunit SecE [Cesiribacter andamanensis AMV16]